MASMAAPGTCLRSPLLQAWAALLARLDAGLCHLLEFENCARAPPDGCSSRWLHASLAAVLLLATLAAAMAMWRLLLHFTARESTRMVAVSAQVLQELRRVAPAQYPSQRHMFAALAPGAATSDPLAPLLCAVCHGGVGGAGAGLAAALQCCSACGLVVHDGCARRAGKTCRPLCCGTDCLPHFWQAKGTVVEEDGGAGGGLSCLYCQEPAETDGLVAAEPLWCCSLCGSACHVECFCFAHPQLPGVAAKLHALLEGKGGGRSSIEGRQEPPPRRRGAPRGSSPSGSSSSLSGSDGDAQPAPALAPSGPSTAAAPGSSGDGLRRRHGAAAADAAAPANSPAPAASPSRLASRLRALAGAVTRRRSDAGAAAAVGAPRSNGTAASVDDSGYRSDSESGEEFDAVVRSRRRHQRRRRRVLSLDLARLDECSLGPNRRSVLPATAVCPALRSGGTSQTRLEDAAAAQAAAATGAAAGGQGGGAGTAAPPSQQPQQGPPGAAGKGGGSRSGGGGRKKGGSWWRRLYSPRRAQWQDYRIERLPPGCKPVLVFVNTKSGPQIGIEMHRAFLRALHPLQVVELPRQAPGPALQLFARVAAHVRVLVVGGDGSVAWVLSSLEELKEQQAAAGDPHWKPPPVGILPLGTGNDLARCLGWGGGHGAWQGQGVGAVLAEVQHAAPLHIDRWDVAFAPPPRPDHPAATPRGKLADMLQRGGSLALESLGSAASALRHVPGGGGGGGAAAGAEPGAAPAAAGPLVVKQLNNYLGIGVDAKVALDFHLMREQMPFFFTSQLGNKFWYTTLGGVDIVSGHACSDLARKLQVVCDGQPLALPPDIEGLLVLNINSYMGGVDLWRNSYSLPGAGLADSSGGGGGGGSGGGRHAAQSMMDGRMEIVAIYGSWHLGQLQVGLSRAVRLGQAHEVTIASAAPLPMQVDGEPWVQAPAQLRITRRGQGLVLRRVLSKPLARMVQAVNEVLEESEQRGTISAAQHHALAAELTKRVQPLLLHPGQ